MPKDWLKQLSGPYILRSKPRPQNLASSARPGHEDYFTDFMTVIVSK